MKENEIKKMIEVQRAYFQTGATLSLKKRIFALKKLYQYISEHQVEIEKALEIDLGKSNSESYMCEVGLTLSEITYMIRHLPKFAKEKTVPTPLAQFASRSFVKSVPYGTVLIMSPWNYPFLLSMEPLVDAIAAGNTCIIKPSAYSLETSKVLVKIVRNCFKPEYVNIVTGGREENSCLLRQKFDYIFFTGSQAVGKEVLRNAAKYLTPVTLELGGKSPCIVDETANIKLAAKRIVFGKYLNCGQTCVAPDYIYCHESIKEKLVNAIKHEIKKQYGKDVLLNKNYGKIINKKHFDRLLGLIDTKKVIVGGKANIKALQIEPVVMDEVTWQDAVMEEEIFGPIMPILTYSSFKELIHLINSKPHPLAGYLFSSSKEHIEYFKERCAFGGGCVNDTIIHLATSNMGFGGVGASGMGAYHGKEGFDTFSHKKSIVDKKTWLDLPMRYQPYNRVKDLLVKMFLR